MRRCDCNLVREHTFGKSLCWHVCVSRESEGEDRLVAGVPLQQCRAAAAQGLAWVDAKTDTRAVPRPWCGQAAGLGRLHTLCAVNNPPGPLLGSALSWQQWLKI